MEVDANQREDPNLSVRRKDNSKQITPGDYKFSTPGARSLCKVAAFDHNKENQIEMTGIKATDQATPETIDGRTFALTTTIGASENIDESRQTGQRRKKALETQS